MCASQDERRFAPNGEINFVYFIFKVTLLAIYIPQLRFQYLNALARWCKQYKNKFALSSTARTPRAKVCPLWLKSLGYQVFRGKSLLCHMKSNNNKNDKSKHPAQKLPIRVARKVTLSRPRTFRFFRVWRLANGERNRKRKCEILIWREEERKTVENG